MIKRFAEAKAWIAGFSWPRPSGRKRLVACHYCDSLHQFEPLVEGKAARCVRCGGLLYENRPASLTRATAFSLTALILMVLVNMHPFLIMDASVMRRELTLFGAAESLIRENAPLLGIATFIFTLVTPIILSGGMIYVCAPLLFGRAAPGACVVTKWMYLSEPWNMVEVFLLGVLVSLLKIAKVADVHFGVGFWAFAGVMLCTAAAVSAIDREELWDRLEIATK